MSQMSLGNPTFAMTPPLETANYNAFPSLGSPQPGSPIQESSLRNLYANHDTIAPPPGFTSRPALAPEFIPSRPQSRPSSRHQSPGPRSPSFSNADSEEAFPSLAAAGLRGPRKHHGKRGHGHGHGHREKELAQSSLADVVRMAPTPAPQSPRRTLRGRGSYTGSGENSTAALAIPAPEKIPWLETGDRANKAYLKARQEALRHGGARNKFLQRYIRSIPSLFCPLPHQQTHHVWITDKPPTAPPKPGTATTSAPQKPSPSQANPKTKKCATATVSRPQRFTKTAINTYPPLPPPARTQNSTSICTACTPQKQSAISRTL